MLDGRIDVAERDRLSGWVQDTDEPDAPVSLLITAGDAVAARVLANMYRPDLAAAGLGDGRHAFDVRLRHPLSPLVRHVVHVQREGDGSHCPGSPLVLEAATTFDDNVRRHLGDLVAAASTDAERLDRLDFLAEQIELLLQRRGEDRARPGERLAQARARSRWADTAGVPPHQPADPPAAGRALVIDERPPDPNRDAGSNAILSHMASLSRLGFEVLFASAEMTPARAVQALGIETCGRPWCATLEELLRREAGGFDLVYLHRESIATRYLSLIRQHQPRARIVLSVGDLQFLRLGRQAAVEQHPELEALSRSVRGREMLAAWSSDAVITHSDHEAALLRREMPGKPVHVVPWSMPIRPVRVPFARRHGVAFVGSYDHLPNRDAARWLVEAIMPLVWQQDPTIRCLLVGSAMPGELRRLAGPRVETIGHAPDLAKIFDQVRLTVAPLRYGAGIKGKVLASMAAGLPCACTPIAAEGLPLPAPWLDLVAPDAAGIAGVIHRLHHERGQNRNCARAGLAHIAEFQSDARIDSLIAAACGSVPNIVQAGPQTP